MVWDIFKMASSFSSIQYRTSHKLHINCELSYMSSTKQEASRYPEHKAEDIVVKIVHPTLEELAMTLVCKAWLPQRSLNACIP